MDIIITTPENLRTIVGEAIKQAVRELSPKQETSLSDRIELKEARQITGLSNSALYKRTMSNEIPYSKFGNRLIFSRKDLTNWILEHTKNGHAENDVVKKLSSDAQKRSK